MVFHDFALVFLAFVSEVIGTLSGFGSSTFFVPMALLVESFKFVLVITAIMHCFGNGFKIFIFRADFQKEAFFRLALPSILLTGLGALLSAIFSAVFLIRGLGIALMVLAILSYFGQRRIQKWPQWTGPLLSGVSGFATGLVGTGGAIRGLALSALNLPKNSFVMISSSIDITGDLFRAAIYLKNDYMDWSQWFYLPLIFLAALLGANLGKRILKHIPQAQFEKIVTIFIFFSGLVMIFEN